MDNDPGQGRAPSSPTSAVHAPAHCALHVDRLAAAPCARCGTFLCAACAIRLDFAEGAHCKDCTLRLDASGSGAMIAWEDKSVFFFKRFWRTVWEVIVSPVRFFSRLGARGLGPAITFQYNAMPIIVVLNLIVTWLRLRAWFGHQLSATQVRQAFTTTAISMVIAVALIPILHFIAAGWLHVHLLLFGAKRGFTATYRFTSYLYALLFVFAILQVVSLATQLDMGPAEVAALMRGKMSGMVIVSMVLTTVIGLVYTTVAAAKAQRMHPAAAFAAIMLVTLEAYGLWLYVLVPLMTRGASLNRF